MARKSEKTTMNADPETLNRLVDWFEEAEEANEEARQLAFRDIDYYDGKQLTAEECAALRKRGQPDTTFNFIGGKIDVMLGLEIQQRADPRAWPRTPSDAKAAEAATDALRYVERKEDLDTLFSESYEDLAKGGFEVIEVLVRHATNGRAEVDLKQPKFDRVFFDPHSARRDFTDARYMGYVLWWDRDQAEKKWPDKAESIAGTISEVETGDFDDRPSHKVWARPGDRPRLRIVTMYWLDGERWHMTKFTRQGVLETDPVPFIDDDGNSVNPMIMQSAYIDRENARYGAVRRLVGPQDEENKRRSKLLHMITVRQTRAEKGAVDDVAEMKAQLARPDGHIETNPGFQFEIIDQSAQAAGQASLMEYSAARMEKIGANAALQGKPDGTPSGRAIILTQQGGIAELTPLSERHRNFKVRVYRAIWQRIRQFWTEERWIRVTDDEDTVRFTGFNRKTTVGAEFARELTEEEGLPPERVEQELQVAREKGENLDAPITVNVPAAMDMDVMIETAPETVTIEQEQFAELANVISSGLELTDPRMKLLIRASQFRNKRELLDLIDGANEPSDAQRAVGEIELATLKAQLDRLIAGTEKTRAEGLKRLTEVDAMDGVIDGQVEKGGKATPVKKRTKS